MSNKVRTLANIGIGLIVLIVTLVVFFLGYANHAKETIDWLALIFVLLSEVALFGGTTVILIRKYTGTQMLISAGIISTLFIYWIAATILSIFSRNIFKDNVRGFATTQIIIFAISLIITMLLFATAINVKENDEKLMSSKTIMKQCESLAYSLKSNINFNAYFSLLNKIYEEIKYSDKTKSVDCEEAIYNKMDLLSTILASDAYDTKIEDVSKMVDDIILLIKERNLSIKQLKQGGL